MKKVDNWEEIGIQSYEIGAELSRITAKLIKSGIPVVSVIPLIQASKFLDLLSRSRNKVEFQRDLRN